MKKEYLEKIYISSGELPEEKGEYITDLGILYNYFGYWYENNYNKDEELKIYPEWYLRPYSPKEEAIEFLKWREVNFTKFEDANPNYHFYYLTKDGSKSYPYSLSELYDKFKEQNLNYEK